MEHRGLAVRDALTSAATGETQEQAPLPPASFIIRRSAGCAAFLMSGWSRRDLGGEAELCPWPPSPSRPSVRYQALQNGDQRCRVPAGDIVRLRGSSICCKSGDAPTVGGERSIGVEHIIPKKPIRGPHGTDRNNLTIACVLQQKGQLAVEEFLSGKPDLEYSPRPSPDRRGGDQCYQIRYRQRSRL